MRLFLYEYTCAMPPSNSAKRTLHAEGRAMLKALLEDFGAVAGVETVTILNDEHGLELRRGIYKAFRQDEETTFRELARCSDFTLVIAPEFNDILLTRCRWVLEAGGRLLGSSPAAVRLAGDKLALGRHLLQHGVPTPGCRQIESLHAPLDGLYPLVWKPRFGAGSQATFLVGGPEEWPSCVAAANAEGWAGASLVQPFVFGLPASAAFLIGGPEPVALLPAGQDLAQDGRFRYLGGSLPLPPALAARAVSLARRALVTIPGLRGYIGVDLVLGNAADGSDDWVIEINPRLTTSYVGLRALAQTNLAEAMLQAARGFPVATISWRKALVRFDAAGQVVLSSVD